MGFEMDWSPDFCLSCDRQTSSGAPYCSQSCRLADLEGSSSPASPALLSSSRQLQASPSPLDLSSGFQLPLAYNFTAHVESSRYIRSSTGRIEPYTPVPRAAPTATATTKTSVFYSAQSSAETFRPLSLSGSQTSLSSLRSTSSTESFVLSDKARTELRDYASAFDQVRNWKRRVSSS